jgi:hypothetical protein
MVRCVQCDTELVAPVRSEYWSDKRACHRPEAVAAFFHALRIGSGLGKISRNHPRNKRAAFQRPNRKSSAVRCGVGNTTKLRRKLSAFSNRWGGEVK